MEQNKGRENNVTEDLPKSVSEVNSLKNIQKTQNIFFKASGTKFKDVNAIQYSSKMPLVKVECTK